MTVATVPATMRAVVIHNVEDVRLEERPVPQLSPGDVLVRMGACGVCSGDFIPWYVARKAPCVFGHEPAGTVVAVRDAADEGWLGARVFAHHHVPCFACAACAHGDYVQCQHWRASSLDPGGMAEFFRVPQANRAELLRLPDGVSFEAASLIEPLACVLKSLHRGSGAPLDLVGHALAPSLSGRSVYVIGLGIMGLLHVAVAANAGAAVLGSDFIDERRSVSERLGARAFQPAHALAGVRSGTGGQGADIVVCGPGTAPALQHALDAVASGGTVVLFAPMPPEDRFALDQGDVYFRDLRIVGSYSAGPPDTALALRMVSAGIVAPERLGAVTCSLHAVPQAYDRMRRGTLVKVITTSP